MSGLHGSHRAAICNDTRHRPHGYRLRCHEPIGHAGEHRWTPELVQRVDKLGERARAVRS